MTLGKDKKFLFVKLGDYVVGTLVGSSSSFSSFRNIYVFVYFCVHFRDSDILLFLTGFYN